MTTERDQLIEAIRQLRPWHHNIRLTDSVQIWDAFSEEERQRANNENVSMFDFYFADCSNIIDGLLMVASTHFKIPLFKRPTVIHLQNGYWRG